MGQRKTENINIVRGTSNLLPLVFDDYFARHNVTSDTER